MDGQAKLTRIRSSIHSLSSIVDIKEYSDNDDEDHQTPSTSSTTGGPLCNSDTVSVCQTRLLCDKVSCFWPKRVADTRHEAKVKCRTNITSGRPNKALSILATWTLTLIITFVYLNIFENLLIILIIFTTVILFCLSKNLNFLHRKKPTIQKHKSNSVQWFIGEDLSKPTTVKVKEGVEFYSNGNYYEGEFNRGKSNGFGVYNYYVNGRYEGEWVDGKYDGYGIESWKKGSMYRGQYIGGLRHGYGVYRFCTGDNYGGQWCNGQYHGIGVQSCFDGSRYFGEFKFGVKHGLGCYHFRNGDRYAGEYFGDKIHGFGIYHFANGHCYEGSWHEGCKQGFGMYTFRNAEAKCGEWDYGSLKTPLPPLSDSVLRAVQAARKAAEDAMNLRRVDDQINNAVVGANRAATAARVAAVKAVQNRMDGKFYDTDA